MDRIFRVGLTGGIASGKTTVANMFGDLGAVLIDTDIIAREVTSPGSPGLSEIARTFGDDVITDEGELDRRTMRSIVFSDEGKRRDLEAIIHPKIRDEAIRRMQTPGGPYQVVVVPLLVESPLKEHVDRILVVDCDEQVQLQRLISRDAESKEQARNIVAAQASRSDRLAIADDIIRNEQSIENTRQKVVELHQKYLSLAELKVS